MKNAPKKPPKLNMKNDYAQLKLCALMKTNNDILNQKKELYSMINAARFV